MFKKIMCSVLLLGCSLQLSIAMDYDRDGISLDFKPVKIKPRESQKWVNHFASLPEGDLMRQVIFNELYATCRLLKPFTDKLEFFKEEIKSGNLKKPPVVRKIPALIPDKECFSFERPALIETISSPALPYLQLPQKAQPTDYLSEDEKFQMVILEDTLKNEEEAKAREEYIRQREEEEAIAHQKAMEEINEIVKRYEKPHIPN